MDIARINIGIFGKMNSGKSTLMNLLTQTNTSITDPTPGTTADTRTCVMELHGLGPVRIFDTAGVDEKGVLGDKKREKVLEVLKECDLALLIIDPDTTDISTEREIIKHARELDKQLLILLNVFLGDKDRKIELPEAKYYKMMALKACDTASRQPLIDFLIAHFENTHVETELLPFLKNDEFYILNIPMDDETPKGRYLKPQAMTEEYITRKWAYPVSFRMNLADARGERTETERSRFFNFIDSFKKRPKCIITDSQAMDIMKKWTPSDIQLTTFSIVMINHMSRGKLGLFVDGLKAIDGLKEGSRVLIVEACNHSRIGEDIGTVQIPKMIGERFPGVTVLHSFGKEDINSDVDLAIHCGGCMITPQKMSARLRDLINLGIPFTNYGLFLSYMQGREALKKVLEPWGL